MLNRLHDKAHGIDVLRLGARAKGLARTAHRHVHIGAHRAFFHVAIAAADIAQDRAQLTQVGPCFGGRAHIGAAHDLHQRNARTVQVNIGHGRVLIVHQLARILFNVDALDADHLVFGNPGLFVRLDQQAAFAHQRVIKLADLVALRQIGVEIVLAVKPAPAIDLCLNRHAGAHRLPDAFAVGHGQHPRHRGIDKADLAIRLCTERGRSARKQLGLRRHLRVDFKADHDLPFAGCALDAIVAHICVLVIPAQAGTLSCKASSLPP